MNTNAKEIVTAFIDALNKEDFASARTYLADNMTFKGILGSRDSGDAYIKDMEQMKMKYDLKKVVADDHDVCILCNVTQGDITFLNCGWYHVAYGKIANLTVIFDPRPVLEAQKKGK